MQAALETDSPAAATRRADAMAPWPALAPYARSLEGSLPRGLERLFYFDSAPGDRSRPALLLVHGLGDEGDSFRHLFPLLAPDFRLLAPDLPGFGRSLARGPTRIALCVEALAALLDREGLAAPAVLGSSLGAAIAQLLVLRRPGGVSALVFEDGGAPAPGKPASNLLGMALPLLGERRYRAYRRDHGAAVASLRPYYADWEALPGADRAFLSARVVDRVHSEGQARAYLSLLRSAMGALGFRPADFGAQLAAWRGPLAVLWGEEDRIVPEASGRSLAALVPGAGFHLVPGAGHLPHQERPEAVAALLRGLLSSPSPSPAGGKGGR